MFSKYDIFGDLLFGFYVKGIFSLTAIEITKWFLLSILVLISYSSLYTFIYFVTHNGIAGSGISISSAPEAIPTSKAI